MAWKKEEKKLESKDKVRQAELDRRAAFTDAPSVVPFEKIAKGSLLPGNLKVT